MAVAYTLTRAGVAGDLKYRHGTFTSAAGDGNAETLTVTTHGLNYLADFKIQVEGFDAAPKCTVSAGTITWSMHDTKGASGTWYVLGR